MSEFDRGHGPLSDKDGVGEGVPSYFKGFLEKWSPSTKVAFRLITFFLVSSTVCHQLLVLLLFEVHALSG